MSTESGLGLSASQQALLIDIIPSLVTKARNGEDLIHLFVKDHDNQCYSFDILYDVRNSDSVLFTIGIDPKNNLVVDDNFVLARIIGELTSNGTVIIHQVCTTVPGTVEGENYYAASPYIPQGLISKVYSVITTVGNLILQDDPK